MQIPDDSAGVLFIVYKYTHVHVYTNLHIHCCMRMCIHAHEYVDLRR